MYVLDTRSRLFVPILAQVLANLEGLCLRLARCLSIAKAATPAVELVDLQELTLGSGLRSRALARSAQKNVADVIASATEQGLL
jgi:hypothetical protein